MYREITERLKKWKTKKNRKPLVLTGVRQCGKTYIIKDFGKNEFSDVAYFMFEKNARLQAVFEMDYDTKRILSELDLICGHKIEAGKTLVIFDEIQACPDAIASLKFFCEECRELHIIAAGSLLGVEIGKENISFPVGKVDRMQMYPMNFREFLIAVGYGELAKKASEMHKDSELSELYTIPLERELRNFYYVGGMPEAVGEWVEDHSVSDVDEIQRGLLDGYENDFSKHAPTAEMPRLRLLYKSIPEQLAKENNKFVFSHVKESARAKEFENSLSWLFDAGLAYKLCLVENPSLPLSMYADDSYFKLYMSDVGLLRCRTKVPYNDLIEWRSDSVYARFRGAFTENFVLTELLSYGIEPYFWRSGNSAEVDFLFENDGRAIPLEAKAEIRTKAQSYRSYCKKYHPTLGFRVSFKNVGINTIEDTESVSLPLYMLWNISKYLS